MTLPGWGRKVLPLAIIPVPHHISEFGKGGLPACQLTIPQINLPRYWYRLTQPHNNGDPTLKRSRKTTGFESAKDSFLKN